MAYVEDRRSALQQLAQRSKADWSLQENLGADFAFSLFENNKDIPLISSLPGMPENSHVPQSINLPISHLHSQPYFIFFQTPCLITYVNCISFIVYSEQASS